MSRMIGRICLCLFCFFPVLCHSQYGVNLKYLIGQSDLLDENLVSQDGYQASLEYHFRLAQKRIEFRPGIGYRATFNKSDLNGYFSSIDFDLNTAIYPFDFEGDCHCPTFSKDGELVKKGFFFELQPGIGYQVLKRLRTDPDDPSKLPIRSKNLVFKIGGAAGLDMGFSEHFTVTPMFSMTMLTPKEWDGLYPDGSKGKLDDYVYLGFGIRFSYRGDDK